jgi:hypothetical protein
MTTALHAAPSGYNLARYRRAAALVYSGCIADSLQRWSRCPRDGC